MGGYGDWECWGRERGGRGGNGLWARLGVEGMEMRVGVDGLCCGFFRGWGDMILFLDTEECFDFLAGDGFSVVFEAISPSLKLSFFF